MGFQQPRKFFVLKSKLTKVESIAGVVEGSIVVSSVGSRDGFIEGPTVRSIVGSRVGSSDGLTIESNVWSLDGAILVTCQGDQRCWPTKWKALPCAQEFRIEQPLTQGRRRYILASQFGQSCQHRRIGKLESRLHQSHVCKGIAWIQYIQEVPSVGYNQHRTSKTAI